MEKDTESFQRKSTATERTMADTPELKARAHKTTFRQSAQDVWRFLFRLREAEGDEERRNLTEKRREEERGNEWGVRRGDAKKKQSALQAMQNSQNKKAARLAVAEHERGDRGVERRRPRQRIRDSAADAGGGKCRRVLWSVRVRVVVVVHATAAAGRMVVVVVVQRWSVATTACTRDGGAGPGGHGGGA
jgi:hypothetical protein